MAFWGAPEADSDHAAHAIATAKNIAKLFEEKFTSDQQNGLPSFRLRIGIHTGRAIIGNIGGEDRVNYTIIGHTVNIANRIEQLGKSLDHRNDDEIDCAYVAVSDACFKAAGSPDGFEFRGEHTVRGSSTPVSVHILKSAQNDSISVETLQDPPAKNRA